MHLDRNLPQKFGGPNREALKNGGFQQLVRPFGALWPLLVAGLLQIHFPVERLVAANPDIAAESAELAALALDAEFAVGQRPLAAFVVAIVAFAVEQCPEKIVIQ